VHLPTTVLPMSSRSSIMSTARPSSPRIPSLDGLRAVSIVFVLFAHLSGTVGFALPVPRFVLGALAGLGVRVFFVISGFLITSLLLAEEQKTGTISLRDFYFRRTMRIFPPFYALVGLISAAAALGWVTLARHDVVAAMTYTTNYHHARSWYLGHAWSLAVEEQFYLLWPFLVKYLGSRRAARVALATVVAAPVLRLVLLVGFPSLRVGIGETFPTVADSIATGCLLACHRARLFEPAPGASPRVALDGLGTWLATAVGLGAAFQPSAKLDCLLGQTATNLAIALVIERVVRFPDRAAGRLLNARPVVYVGTLSYSLYLWQQPFLDRHSTALVSRFPLNLGLAATCALLSFYLIERPALRLRSRIEARARHGPGPAAAPAA